MAPWQVSFIIVAAPGIPILLLLMTIKDRRSSVIGPKRASDKVLPFLSARKSFFIYYCLGIGLLTTVSYANMAWIPSMFSRIHGWPTPETATWLGYMMLLFGTAGILSGGFCAVWLSTRYRDATLRVAFFGAALLVPICALAALMPNPWLSLACYAPFTFISTSFVSLGPTSIQYITPDSLRGRVTGTSLMFVNLIGVAVGPLFIALITDHVFQDEKKLDWALGLGTSFLSFISALMIWFCLTHYRRLLDRGQEDVSAIK
jgi:MFS family permease